MGWFGDSTIKRVMRLIDNIRQYGHLKADIYPVNPPERQNVPKLEIEDFDLDKETLEKYHLELSLNILKTFMTMPMMQLFVWKDVTKDR